jgi:hypothetical protein
LGVKEEMYPICLHVLYGILMVLHIVEVAKLATTYNAMPLITREVYNPPHWILQIPMLYKSYPAESIDRCVMRQSPISARSGNKC